jgi:uncharacterized membrane protein
MDQSASSEPERIYFDAVLRPHRSLSPTGFATLMAAIAGLSFVAGLRFWVLGAWPIAAFLALDVLLIYIAFKLNYRSGRRYETIRLTDQALTVQQVSPQGDATIWRFQPYWLRVDLAEMPDRDGALTLRSHGHAVEIGAFLSPDERHAIARDLTDALARQRRPQFD